MADYSAQDIGKVLSHLEVNLGDHIFIHSNLAAFGTLEGVRKSDELCENFEKELRNVIGPQGTIVVPAFTYSPSKDEVFDLNSSIKNMGIFSEWIRRNPSSTRSLDPFYSVAALGDHANELTTGAPENSFGEDCFFERFLRLNGKILNFNLDAGSTFLHYVERRLSVPYRFDKTFTAKIVVDGKFSTTKSTIWVRDLLDPETEADFAKFDLYCETNRILKRTPLGRGIVTCISARDSYRIVEEQIRSREDFLIRGSGEVKHVRQ